MEQKMTAIEKAIELLDWYFNEDDGIGADMDVKLSWQKIRFALQGVPEGEFETSDPVDESGTK